MRRLHVSVFSLITAGLVALAAVSPATAADGKPLDVSATARVASMPSPTGPTAPDTSYAGLDETNVTVGLETAGVPCVNCAQGGGTPNVGLPWPIFGVQKGASLTVTTLFESTSFTGPCTAGLIVKQGGKVVATGTYSIQGGCLAGYLYYVYFNIAAPSSAGFTTFIGSISGGANMSGADTFINVQ